MRPDRVFPSRIDAWLLGIVFAAALLPFGVGVVLLLSGAAKAVWLPILWGLVISTTMYALSWPMAYTFRPDHLHIRSGWLEWTVPYGSIRRAAPSANPLSGPAWSLRRVRIDQNAADFILVSPDDRESFISELAERCPHLVRAGAGLVPRPASP